MKKKILSLIIAVLALVLAASVVLVACNDDKPTYYTVSFGGDGIDIPSQSVESGKTAVRPSEPTRDGFDFGGWYVEGTDPRNAFSFDTPITSDVRLIAIWTEKGSLGSRNNPYIIKTADDLLDFADRLNSLDEEEDPNYHKAFFRLDADIDMSGYNWIAACQPVELSADGGESIVIEGFMGDFDGNGHTISNISINKMLRTGISNVGFFGATYMANIHDLTLENIYYEVESNGDNNTVGAYIGAVAGYAQLTNFTNVRVGGTLETRVLTNNPVYMGGLAGELTMGYGKSYMVYTENCHANITNVIGKYDDGDQSVLINGALGGLFGVIYNSSSSAVAIVNSSTAGSLDGGQWVGGLVGSITGGYVSTINCASHTRCTSKNEEVSYVGGLIGSCSSDILIMDSYATGAIKATKATGTTYKSYAGGIIGFAAADDYEWYLTYGVAVVNCYYSGNIREYDVLSSLGTKADKASFTKDWAVETLGWQDEIWTFDENNNAVPTNVRSIDLADAYTITYMSNDQTFKQETRIPSDVETYALVREIEGLENDKTNGVLFYGWEIAPDVAYRFYMPIVKDVTFTARWQDVNEIAGIYTGTGTLGETVDAGVIVLNKDGSMQWINSSTVGGDFIYDGEHIIMNIYSNVGETCGTLTNDTLEFLVDAGMTGQVSYTFTKSNLRYFGEYYSENGDVITFSSNNNLSFQSSGINDGNYMSGTFTEDGDTLTVTGKYLANYYDSMTITVNEDMTITVNFVGSGTTPSITNVVFGKMGSVDYSDEGFVGTYNMIFSSKSDFVYSTNYRIKLNADGTAEYISAYSTTKATYYAFNDGTLIKMQLEGNMCTFEYDAERDILYGIVDRGTTIKRYCVLTKEESGELKAYYVDNSYDTVLFATANDRYFVENKQYKPDAQIEGSLEKGERVTVNGAEYRVVYNSSGSIWGWNLTPIGDEEGVYTYNNGQSFELDGIGNVIGGGKYWIFGDSTVFVMFDDDSIVGFDYLQAQRAGNVITEKAHDAYQGVWYMDREVDEDDDSSTPKVLIKKYYKVVVSGYGQATVLYYHIDSGTYRFNWSGWGAYTVTSTGISARFNEYQLADIMFFYENKMMYSKSFGYMGESYFYAEGYTGELALPVFDASHAGSYTGVMANGTAVTLNLNSDLTGSYRGLPFSALYDGEKTVFFDISGTMYYFDIQTNTLTYGDENIVLTLNGEVNEVIPAGLAGTWDGTWEGANADGASAIVIETNGTITFCGMSFDNVVWDSQTNTITCDAQLNGEVWTLTLTWDVANNTINAKNTFEYDGQDLRRDASALTKTVVGE